MKKLIIVAVLVIASSMQMLAGPIISISIEFGHLDGGGNCIERGFCRVIFGGSRNMTAQINDNTGNLEMTFLKSANQTAIYEVQFANGVFEVPVAYALNSELCQKLGVDKFTVKAGKYKVEETRGQYKIVFQK